MKESRYSGYLAELENENDVRFARLVTICTELFGDYRTAGSHHIWKMPWPGNPRINLQKVGKKAKPYQVLQVIDAIKKLEASDAETKKSDEG